MVEQIRNLGRPGIASMAIAAVDNALWDWKGQLLDISVASLLRLVRTGIMAYARGGFTFYSNEKLRKQLGGWAETGFLAEKMKIGGDTVADLSAYMSLAKQLGRRSNYSSTRTALTRTSKPLIRPIALERAKN
jgi:L-alanine-DL-glutamate epimerase-like enolase superfamily enzyme